VGMAGNRERIKVGFGGTPELRVTVTQPNACISLLSLCAAVAV
jgi:hypothetical protein